MASEVVSDDKAHLAEGSAKFEEPGSRHLSGGHIRDGWLVLNVQSHALDGAMGRYAYFDETATPGYPFGDKEARARLKQYRNGELVWEGEVLLWRGTEGMAGSCGMEACTATVRREWNHAAYQWAVWDVVVVEGFHDVSLAAAAVERPRAFADANHADIASIVLIIILGIVACGSVLLVGCYRQRRHRVRAKAEEDGPPAWPLPAASAPPELSPARGRGPVAAPAVDLEAAGAAEAPAGAPEPMAARGTHELGDKLGPHAGVRELEDEFGDLETPVPPSHQEPP